MPFTEIETSQHTTITIWESDHDGEAELEIDSSDKNVSAWINKDQARQIIAHLTKEFGL